jgi:hypothetical protein
VINGKISTLPSPPTCRRLVDPITRPGGLMARKHPKPNRKDVRRRRREYTVDDPIQEKQVATACNWLQLEEKRGKLPKISEVARKFGVKYHILRSRYLRTHKPLKVARADQQALTPAQENIVKDWICYLGAMGLPIGVSELGQVIKVVLGKQPSKQWIYRQSANSLIKLSSSYSNVFDNPFTTPSVFPPSSIRKGGIVLFLTYLMIMTTYSQLYNLGLLLTLLMHPNGRE